MSGAWTPGPWEVRRHESGDPYVAKTAYVLAEVYHTGPLGERQANARLIAAAPGLYEALELARLALIGCGMNTASPK